MLGVDIVELGGADQSIPSPPARCPQARSLRRARVSVPRATPRNGTLSGVVREADPPILQEPREARPVLWMNSRVVRWLSPPWHASTGRRAARPRSHCSRSATIGTTGAAASPAALRALPVDHALVSNSASIRFTASTADGARSPLVTFPCGCLVLHVSELKNLRRGATNTTPSNRPGFSGGIVELCCSRHRRPPAGSRRPTGVSWDVPRRDRGRRRNTDGGRARACRKDDHRAHRSRAARLRPAAGPTSGRPIPWCRHKCSPAAVKKCRLDQGRIRGFS